jgi:FMN phosphatase YigB (HAD superfamily)
VGFIFDMGNVLSLDVDVLPCMAAKLGMTVGQITGYAGDDFDDLLVGAKTAEEFWGGFNRHFGTDVREDLLITCFHPSNDVRMEQLILDLKAGGHRVVCGTNAFETHYRYHLARGQYAVFDRVYASNLLGIAKPSPAFFRHILDREGWPAGETFFIDDRAANVAAAGDLGMQPFLYDVASPAAFAALLGWLAEKGALPADQSRNRTGR